jgi:hypothetical protein
MDADDEPSLADAGSATAVFFVLFSSSGFGGGGT